MTHSGAKRVKCCGGRLTGNPLVQTVLMPDGTTYRWFYGRRWKLDGMEIHPSDAHLFRGLWRTASRNGRLPADWMPPDW